MKTPRSLLGLVGRMKVCVLVGAIMGMNLAAQVLSSGALCLFLRRSVKRKHALHGPDFAEFMRGGGHLGDGIMS